jgi:hypothetical protein
MALSTLLRWCPGPVRLAHSRPAGMIGGEAREVDVGAVDAHQRTHRRSKSLLDGGAHQGQVGLV